MAAQKDNLTKVAQSLVILGTIVGGAFAAYSFLTERPSRLLEQAKAEVIQRVNDGKADFRREIEARAVARDKEIASIRDEFRRQHDDLKSMIGTVSDQVERIDQRLDGLLPRGKNDGRKSAASRGGEDNGS